MVMNGVVVELGGDAWASPNQYMVQLTKELNITVDGDNSNANHVAFSSSRSSSPASHARKPNRRFLRTSTTTTSSAAAAAADPPAPHHVGRNDSIPFAVWDGDAFLDIAGIFKNNSMQQFLGELDLGYFLLRLASNYFARDHLAPNQGRFETVSQFLAAGGNLDEYTNATTRAYMLQHGLNEALLDGFIVPLTRTIYDQEDNINTFASMVSMHMNAGIGAACSLCLCTRRKKKKKVTSKQASLTALVNALSARDGNSVVVEALFRASGARVMLNTRATNVLVNLSDSSPTGPGGFTFTVQTEQGAAGAADAKSDCGSDGAAGGECADNGADKDGGAALEVHVDALVLATPLEIADISFIPAQPGVPVPS